MNILSVSDLVVSKNNQVIINHFSYTFDPGKIYVLMGPSGSGKSTLLRELQTLSSDVNYAYLTQKSTLLAWLNVQKNLELALKYKPHNSLNDFTSIIDPLKYKMPKTLSGGEERIVSLVRTLATNSDVYFLDEPFSGVDLPSRMKLIKIIKDYQRKNAKTFIIITHDLQEATELADKIILVDKPLRIKHVLEGDFDSEALKKYLG